MLDVTRQSVSKWESGQSMPDISKIVLMSEIFSVSTDDLLKDDIAVLCGPDTSDTRDEAIKVSSDKAEEYMMYSKYQAKMYAAATALCIFSPAPLIFLLADAGSGRLPASVSVILGLLALFIFVACGTSMFIYTSIKNQQYKYLDEQSFILDKSAREKNGIIKNALFLSFCPQCHYRRGALHFCGSAGDSVFALLRRTYRDRRMSYATARYHRSNAFRLQRDDLVGVPKASGVRRLQPRGKASRQACG